MYRGLYSFLFYHLFTNKDSGQKIADTRAMLQLGLSGFALIAFRQYQAKTTPEINHATAIEVVVSKKITRYLAKYKFSQTSGFLSCFLMNGKYSWEKVGRGVLTQSQ